MIGAITKAIAQPSESQIIWNLIFKTSGFQMCPDFEWPDDKSPMCAQDKQKSEFLSIQPRPLQESPANMKWPLDTITATSIFFVALPMSLFLGWQPLLILLQSPYFCQ